MLSTLLIINNSLFETACKKAYAECVVLCALPKQFKISKTSWKIAKEKPSNWIVTLWNLFKDFIRDCRDTYN